MKLAIHDSRESFSQRWIAYCERKGIPNKLVNCYRNDIVDQIRDCDALFWHHQQGNPKDILFAKALLFAVEHAGTMVFPDFRTNWHFDDKVGQKYLLEALDIDALVPTWVFYDKQEALEWVSRTEFPKVFKLRGGAGSQNVRLVHSKDQAIRLVRQAFGKGFSRYDSWGSLRERWRKFRLGKAGWVEVLKGTIRLFVAPPYARVAGRDKGYVYFQEFIPGNDSDIRIIVVGHRAFAIRRLVREHDFRASGSGLIEHSKDFFQPLWIATAFQLADRLGMQAVAFDFVLSPTGDLLLLEVNFGFAPSGYDACPGYWDKDLRWHEGPFDPYGWMVEEVIGKMKGGKPFADAV